VWYKIFSYLIICGLITPGCSVLLVQSADDCEIRPTQDSLQIAFCGNIGRENRDAWLTGVPESVYDMDQALADLDMPPLSPYLVGTTIFLRDSRPGSTLSGQYKGYREPSTRRIDLFLRESAALPWQSAFTHEEFHHYDHMEMGVTTEAEWHDSVEARGRHFQVPIIADYVIEHGRDPENHNTSLETTFCGGVE
jgi:hypothetical protein